ncbi:hypothetical protein GGP41_010303 [Bipolaris sorokiniana]|uniref:Uncharacterized protein n=1 Tax=Cochliobolus sativus TaxID=45130 RepID=A0A8H5ZM23_COCSA|nr:hypothetical protein GGP41_010303 [Bipolaris sorokiniana]
MTTCSVLFLAAPPIQWLLESSDLSTNVVHTIEGLAVRLGDTCSGRIGWHQNSAFRGDRAQRAVLAEDDCRDRFLGLVGWTSLRAQNTAMVPCQPREPGLLHSKGLAPSRGLRPRAIWTYYHYYYLWPIVIFYGPSSGTLATSFPRREGVRSCLSHHAAPRRQ